MKQVVSLILNQKEKNKVLFAKDVRVKNITGYQPEININVRDVNSEPLYEAVLYYMVLNYLTITGILE